MFPVIIRFKPSVANLLLNPVRKKWLVQISTDICYFVVIIQLKKYIVTDTDTCTTWLSFRQAKLKNISHGIKSFFVTFLTF